MLNVRDNKIDLDSIITQLIEVDDSINAIAFALVEVAATKKIIFDKINNIYGLATEIDNLKQSIDVVQSNLNDSVEQINNIDDALTNFEINEIAPIEDSYNDLHDKYDHITEMLDGVKEQISILHDFIGSPI